MLEYLTTVLRLCPQGGRTCETGIGSGYNAIWLSLRGILAEGVDYAPAIVERAKQVNNILRGKARFRLGDLFHLYKPHATRYNVIHHQGVLEHFTAPQIRAALAQQVALADWVVFSVPSVYYPFEPEFGDERVMPLEVWREILSPFQIAELRYHGDPQHGQREHILCILRGEPVSEALLGRMQVAPFLEGITAIVHTRNEERHIPECLQTLQGWTDQSIVCDMESEDRTVEIAREMGAQIVPHPVIKNFDRARNVSAMLAQYRWVFYLDADERVPPALGQALRHLTQTQGESFEALLIPFRHHFVGHWLKHLYPGYTAPRLFRNGLFRFNTRLHSGAQVDGRTVQFPADNPELALVHYSFDSMAHYLDKLNRYTDGEAANMHKDGKTYHWKSALNEFVYDFQSYYDRLGAHQDGVHGFIYSFLSAFYRFEQYAKLYEHRFREGSLQPAEREVPQNVEEILEYALNVARQKPLPQPPRIQVVPAQEATANVVWSGPVFDPSGYGEESREFVFSLRKNGLHPALLPIPWSKDVAEMPEEERGYLEGAVHRTVAPGFMQVVHNFAPGFWRHPQAGIVVGRTVFETDRLPLPWVQACNQMDAIWVATEFNRQTFSDAGVDPAKMTVIPECFEPSRYRQVVAETALSSQLKGDTKFHFLTMFDWTLHKGWDVLLRSFLQAFEGREDVSLLLKVWSTMGYSPEQVRQQAFDCCKRELGHDLENDPRILWVQDRVPLNELVALYHASDAFFMPSRGEGWGRPYMEAMACGLPTIGTNWSGNTAFMHTKNSYLLDCAVQPVPEIGWREIGTYRGHRWAEPDVACAVQTLQRVVAERGEALAKAKRGQGEVCSLYNRQRVGKLLKDEIEHLQEAHKPHPVSVALPPAKRTKRVEPLRIRFEGAQFSWHSLAHVNREICRRLLPASSLEVALVSTEKLFFNPSETEDGTRLAERCFAPLSAPADIHIRHFFPPRFERPEEGDLVLIQPWEYGYLPQLWIEPIQQNAREVWCYSDYVRQVYLNSGIAEEKVKVVPLGVDAKIFHPAALPYVFTAEPGFSSLPEGLQGKFSFLFVGGTLHRKGIDILLDAYLKAFSAYDDVCLIIKDTGTQTVYKGQNERERILGLVGDPTRPPILYIEDDLTPLQLAGLYTLADCLVQPYRGEGFCLPALEAMACGVPVIVPEGGPTNDFIDESVGWRVKAERKPFGDGRIGHWDCVGDTWMFEIAVETLARQMRAVLRQPEEAKAKGVQAAERVTQGWTWEHTHLAVMKRLEALRSPAKPAVPKRRRGEPTPPQEESESAIRDRRSSRHPAPVEAKPGATAREGKTLSPRKMPTITLCMIVKNEERVLPDCLASVKPYVDEIIFVDTGSSDKTVEIAQSFGVKLVHFEWIDDFSAARNVSLEHATGDWVLWMDADDTLPAECGQRLHELVFIAEEETTGYLMQVHIPPAPGDVGFTVVDHVKLFRNRPEYRFTGRIHEQILESISQSGGKIERSGLHVVHSGYDYSPEGQKKKRERDLRILAKELAERPNYPFVLFNIGMTEFHLKDFTKAEEALERCLSLSKPHESTVRKVYSMLAGCRLEQGDVKGARDWAERGLALTPNDPELLFRAGIIHREAGDHAASERSYLQLLTARETGHIDSIDISITTFKAHHNLAMVYVDMGRQDEAERHWMEAVQYSPQFLPSWLGLGELYLKLRRFEDVERIIGHLSSLEVEVAERLRQQLVAVRGR